jgi:hypothetical protein
MYGGRQKTSEDGEFKHQVKNSDPNSLCIKSIIFEKFWSKDSEKNS